MIGIELIAMVVEVRFGLRIHDVAPTVVNGKCLVDSARQEHVEKRGSV